MAEETQNPTEKTQKSTEEIQQLTTSNQDTASSVPDLNSAATPMETEENDESKTRDINPNEPLKGKYTEEEKLKRKEYFNRARERKRQNYLKNKNKKLVTTKKGNNSELSNSDIFISFKMTEEEKEMLEFYQVRLSTLKSENEILHRRLRFLVKENTRLLQKGPPKLAV